MEAGGILLLFFVIVVVLALATICAMVAMRMMEHLRTPDLPPFPLAHAIPLRHHLPKRGPRRMRHFA